MNPVLWQAMGTEFILIFGVLLLIVSEHWLEISGKISGIVYICILFSAVMWTVLNFPKQTIIVSHIYKSNRFTGVIELMILTFFILFHLGGYMREDKNTSSFDGAIRIFELMMLSGLLVTAGAVDLKLMYVGLELFSISVLLKINCYFEKRNIDFIHGSFWQILGSGTILLGMSIINWCIGSNQYEMIMSHLANSGHGQETILIGISFILTGVLIKTGMVPFHGWLLRLQKQIPMTVYISIYTASSLILLILLSRITCNVIWPMELFRSVFITALGGVTIFVCFLSCFMENNFKNWFIHLYLGFQGIVILGLNAVRKLNLRSGFPDGLTAAVFQWIIIILTLVVWMFFSSEIKSQDKQQFTYFRTLVKSVLFLNSAVLIGIPLTAGFSGRFYLLGSLLFQSKWVAGALLATGSLAAGYAVYSGRRMVMISVQQKGGLMVHYGIISLLGALVFYLGLFPSAFVSKLTISLHMIW